MKSLLARRSKFRRERICGQTLNLLFELRARPGPKKLRVKLSIRLVENCRGNRSVPRWINSAIECVNVDPRFLPVIGKIRSVHRQKVTYDVQIRVRVETHAKKNHSLWLIFFRQPNQHRVFRSAWLAPRRPKIHHQGLAFVFRHQFLIARQIDQRKFIVSL